MSLTEMLKRCWRLQLHSDKSFSGDDGLASDLSDDGGFSSASSPVRSMTETSWGTAAGALGPAVFLLLLLPFLPAVAAVDDASDFSTEVKPAVPPLPADAVGSKSSLNLFTGISKVFGFVLSGLIFFGVGLSKAFAGFVEEAFLPPGLGASVDRTLGDDVDLPAFFLPVSRSAASSSRRAWRSSKVRSWRSRSERCSPSCGSSSTAQISNKPYDSSKDEAGAAIVGTHHSPPPGNQCHSHPHS